MTALLHRRALAAAIAGHAAVIAFILAAQTRDLVSPPAYAGGHAVDQPFAFGRCVPLTSVRNEEPFISGDEGLAEPVWRCAGWTRPLLHALGAGAAAGLLVFVGGSLARRIGRGQG